MPKEITHWLIAVEVLTGFNEGSPMRKVLEDSLDYYLLGAVVYDTPYSYPGFTSGQKAFRQLADTLHGAGGEDVFGPFSRLLSSQGEIVKSELLAFALGMFTHVTTDTNFHPLIYYLTGNYYSTDKSEKSKAISNHRWLESNLDLSFLNAFEEEPLLSNKKFLKNILSKTKNLEPVLKDFCQAIPLEDTTRGSKEFDQALYLHSFFQRLFFNNLVRVILSFLLGKESKLTALFYPSTQGLKAERKIYYRHPVTGEEREASLRELKGSTVAKIKESFQEIERVLFFSEQKEKDLKELLQDLPNRSLETGMYKVKPSEMKYFKENFNRELWLQEN